MLEAHWDPSSLDAARVKSDYLRSSSEKPPEGSPRAALSARCTRPTGASFGSEHVQTAAHLRNLCVLLDALDRIDEAEQACRDSQGVFERHLGAWPRESRTELPGSRRPSRPSGKVEEAESLYRRSLAIRRARLGPDHRATVQNLQLLALFLLNQGKLDES